VPISLFVTLEIMKYYQATVMSWDKDMFGPGRIQTTIQSSCLNEDLGTVQVIASYSIFLVTKLVPSPEI